MAFTQPSLNLLAPLWSFHSLAANATNLNTVHPRAHMYI